MHPSPTEPYPGFTAESAAHAAHQQALRDASADPLPGPLADAFASLPDQIAGLRVRKMVHYDFVIMKLVGSPVLEQLRNQGKKGKTATPFDDADGYQMIYQFTRPVEELADWLAKRAPGRAAPEFRKLALREIGMALGPVEVALLVKMVERTILDAFSTALQYAEKDPPPGDTVFTPPPASPSTASAGGSTTSVA